MGRALADIVAEIAERVDGAPVFRRGGRRAREAFLSLLDTREEFHARMFGAFDIAWPLADDDARMAGAFHALSEIVPAMADVIAEPREKPARPRHAGDAEIVAHAPRFRFADTTLCRDPKRPELGAWPAETGAGAIILPVRFDPHTGFGETLSCARMRDEDFIDSVADLIAIPLDGSRPLSFTGHTLTIGRVQTDARGRLILHASGKAWLDAHLARARAVAGDWPAHLAHLVASECLPFAPAEDFSTLLIEPRALEWRVARFDCVVPDGCREIVCPDSRSLAEWIDAEMKKRERTRPAPVVRGPSRSSSEAVAHKKTEARAA